MITRYPIEWWVERVKTPLSLARFGDGEFLCVQGREGGNSHGCAYTDELKTDLVQLLADTSTSLLKGMQRILPAQYREVRPLLAGEWVETEVWGDMLAEGRLKPFFDALWARPVVIVSSAAKNAFPRPHDFIETPLTNAHAAKDDIVRAVLSDCKPLNYLFACGMAAGPIIHALHGKIPGASFIDIGHLLDPFIGDNSREYLKEVPADVLAQNL